MALSPVRSSHASCFVHLLINSPAINNKSLDGVKNKDKGITVNKLQDRTSQYSAIIRSPTASPEILPRGGSMGGMDN
jgi:hypothetical protein